MRSASPRARAAGVAFAAGAFAIAAWQTPAGAGERLSKLKQDASNFRYWNHHDNALKACRAILEHPDATDADKVEAYNIMLDVRWRQGKRDMISETASRLQELFPDRTDAGRVAHFWWSDHLRESRRYVEALVKLREYVARAPEDKPGSADARIKIAEVLRRIGKHAEAVVEAEASAALVPDDGKRVSEALRYVIHATWDNRDMPGCLEAIERIREERYIRHCNDGYRRSFQHRRAEALERLGRYDEAREALNVLARTDRDARRRSEWALRAARTCMHQERWAEAAEAFERVIVEHPGVNDRWDEAQKGIVEALRAKGDHRGALRAARICLDAARDRGQAGHYTRLVAGLLAAVDDNVKRANAFLDYQHHGPEGPDGERGTADDLRDPLRDVGYPDRGEREKAFAGARAEAGDGWEASRHRALTFIYAGRPEDALPYFVDAFRRTTERDLWKPASDMIVIGVRAARGHAAGVEQALRFVAHGPAGPDGRPGTPDDIPDPVAPLLKGSIPERRGVDLAGHSAEDVKALREASAFLEEYIGRPAGREDERREPLGALLRVHEALGDWGREGLRDWFLSRAARETDDQAQGHCVLGGQAAARAGADHLGSVAVFWRELDTIMKRAGRGLAGRSRDFRRRCQDVVRKLADAREFSPKPRHLRPGSIPRDWKPGKPHPWTEAPRKADTTPPDAPRGLGKKGRACRSVELAWEPVEDAESGVAFYNVYRDGERVAIVKAPGFTDDGVAEGSRHVYQISAVSGIGMESRRTRLAVETGFDREPPRVAGVLAMGNPKLVTVTFDEPVERAGAEEAKRYRVTPAADVSSAKLSEDGCVVSLSVAGLEEGIDYRLAVNGVRDTSRARNAVAGGPVSLRYVHTGDGLLGTYHDERDFKGRTATRVDPQVGFKWHDNQDTGTGIRANEFTVRWTGKVRVERDGKWTFIARTDDGVRLWVDGRRIVDAWQDRGAADSPGEIDLQAGRRYDIRMDYYQGSGEGVAELFWEGPGTPRQLVPGRSLYSK
ncbi:MAG: PA14 domain-containing protein [Planctomycetota bacterium]|jgi:tetratricopeptide (TPR) repeat protein